MATTSSTGAVPAERVIARLRPHVRALFWPSLVLISCSGAVAYFGGTLPEAWENVAVFVSGALLAVLLFFLPLLYWLGKRYTITTRRLILRRGFFLRVRQEVLHSRGYGVTVRSNWLQGAFRSGDIVIQAGGEGAVVLKDVPRVRVVQSALHDLMENSQLNMFPRTGGTSAVDGPFGIDGHGGRGGYLDAGAR